VPFINNITGAAFISDFSLSLSSPCVKGAWLAAGTGLNDAGFET